MENIILFSLATLMTVGVILYWEYRVIKKTDNLLDKIIEILITIVIVTIILIYLLDRFNIPTILGWNMNINTQNWLSFMGAYVTGIVGAIISALVAFGFGYVSIVLLRLLIAKVGLSGFAYYSWGASLLTFILYLKV